MSALPLLATAGSGISINGNALSTPVEILVSLTLLALLPGVLLTVTGFTRILIVLGFVRNALGTPTIPPNQVLVGIAFFLSLFVMAPTLQAGQHDRDRAVHAPQDRRAARRSTAASQPLRTFMFKQTRDSDLALFVRLSAPASARRRAPTCRPTCSIPAFIISELKTAFQIGFLIFLPFLIIDMVVSSTLMSMGMMMLPPVLISLPFKILLFVLVDGWYLVVQRLVQSFH